MKKEGEKMAKPWSKDLREKVLRVFEEGKMKIKKICEIFNVDEKTLYYPTGSVK